MGDWSSELTQPLSSVSIGTHYDQSWLLTLSPNVRIGILEAASQTFAPGKVLILYQLSGISLLFLLVRSSLANPRHPGSTCGGGLGKVRTHFCSGPPLMRFPYTSSKWAQWVVTSAWVGVVGSITILLALAAPGYSQGTLSNPPSILSNISFSKKFLAWPGLLCLHCGFAGFCYFH
jgi:hypothetical protein